MQLQAKEAAPVSEMSYLPAAVVTPSKLSFSVIRNWLTYFCIFFRPTSSATWAKAQLQDTARARFKSQVPWAVSQVMASLP